MLADEIGDGGGARLKEVVTAAINDTLAPVRARRRELEQDPAHVAAVLAEGNRRAREIAAATLERTQEAMGMAYA